MMKGIRIQRMPSPKKQIKNQYGIVIEHKKNLVYHIVNVQVRHMVRPVLARMWCIIFLVSTD